MPKKFSKESPKLRQELQELREQAGLRAEQRGMVPNESGFESAIGNEATELFDERQINTWDLVNVSYLEQGATVARAVCKLHARDEKGPYVGTAFLVSERLLVTNHHNLPTELIASTAFVEFDHEIDPSGFPRNPERFVLKPQDAYWSNEDLDICVVAVASHSQGNRPITQYGSLVLNPAVGKIREGQFVSLIHHPDGDWKQVALRENRLLKKAEQVLWYASDTSTGSSGAPCFSDRWQVVAIHRRGVPQTKEGDNSLIALRNGEYMTRDQIRDLRIMDSDILWIANEGVRVSVLVNTIRQDTNATQNVLISSWLADINQDNIAATPARPTVVNTIREPSFIENRRPVNNYEQRNGYQSDFLGIDVPPPSLDGAIQRWGRTSYNSDTGDPEFSYYNFSVWMSYERRLAFVAAVNIDGANHNERNRDEFGGDKWVFDDRLPERLQVGNWFYGNEPASHNKNYFDRGHIVRRTEPSWGPTDSARLANDDTFHWTNCSPQYKSFNQQSRYWQGLETYLLEDGAVQHNKRMTFFTGPIFSIDDTEHRSILVPKQFFKVAVFLGHDGTVRSAAYVLDQSEWVDLIDFERARQLDVKSVRRSVSWLEDLTGLDFGEVVRAGDSAAGLGNDVAEIANLSDLFV